MRGGGGGIRTLGTLARTTVFETVPFNHSGTPPQKQGAAGIGLADPAANGPPLLAKRWRRCKHSLALPAAPHRSSSSGPNRQRAQHHRASKGRRRSAEHKSELQYLMRNSYALFRLK